MVHGFLNKSNAKKKKTATHLRYKKPELGCVLQRGVLPNSMIISLWCGFTLIRHVPVLHAQRNTSINQTQANIKENELNNQVRKFLSCPKTVGVGNENGRLSGVAVPQPMNSSSSPSGRAQSW